jgi:diguanylate cyclase (GGDEF)-like protein/PAS domain S-box-containing protein
VSASADENAVTDSARGRRRATNRARVPATQTPLLSTEALIRGVPSAIWAHTLDGEVLISNDRWFDLTGQPSGATERDGWVQVVHPDDRDRIRASWRALEDGPPDGEMRHALRVVHAVTGEERTLAECARLLCDETGRKVAIVGVTHDITDQARAEASVRRHAAEMEALTRTLPVAVWRAARDGTLIFSTHQWETITGQSVQDALGRGWVAIICSDDREAAAAAWQEFVERPTEWRREYRFHRPNGDVRWMLELGLPVRDDDGSLLQFVGTSMDITEQRLADQATAYRAAQQQAVADLGRRALDAETQIGELMNEATGIVATILGVDIAGVGELHDNEIMPIAMHGIPADTLGPAIPADATTLPGLAVIRAEPVAIAALNQDGAETTRPIRQQLGIVSGAAAPIPLRAGMFGVVSVYTYAPRHFSGDELNFLDGVALVLGGAIERGRAEDAIRHQALHDALTGLPNRALLLDRLEAAVERSLRQRDNLAVLFCDLDRFKLVNDSLGHDTGDELLVKVAQRLPTLLRVGDGVARLGGDEFVIVLEGLRSAAQAVVIAQEVIDGLRRPFEIRNDELFVSVSIGVATLSPTTESPQALLRDADAAMYRAKARGGNGFDVFDAAMRSRALRQLRTENLLRRAIDQQEFEVHYQPVVRLTDGTLDGFEALVRWHHPHHGLVPPAEFIPIAEETGLIVPIGQAVLAAACRQAAAWNTMTGKHRPTRVSVNLSARQVADDTLTGYVAQLLAETGLDQNQLGLEITESVLIEDTPSAARNLQRLRELGVRILLDDFGTGFSSLSYLRRFPIDALKLDRSFVADTAGVETDADTTIITAVARLADALGLAIIAEGVETAEQARMLRTLGYPLAQGYLFARPLLAADATALLHSGPQWSITTMRDAA